MGKVIKYTNKGKKGSSSSKSTPAPPASCSEEKRNGAVINADGNWSEDDLNIHRQLLQKLVSDGEFAQANIVAKHLNDLQPDDPYAWYLRGCALLALSDPEHAEPCLLRSMEIAGVDCWDCFQMSAARLLQEDLEGAVDWCRRAIKLDPDRPPFRWKLMEIHAIQGDLKAAIAVGKKALTKATEKSDAVRTRRMLANLYLSMSDFDEAAETLNEALQWDADDSELWSALGRCMSRQKRWGEAMEAFQRAAEIDPHDATNLYNIGDAFLGLRQPEKAVGPLRQAVRLQPDYSLAHYDLSLAYFELKNYQEAEAAARAALRDDPEMAFQLSNLGLGATENLGLALLNQERMEEAEACFKRNLGLVASTYFNLGLTLFRTKQFPEALENFRRALELEPENPEFHNLLGQTHDELGQPVEAEQSLRRAIEIDGNYALGYYDLGVILSKREGRNEEALAAFEQALKLDSELPWADYCIACLHAVAGKEKQALDLLEKAFRKGFREFDHIETDSDWDGFRMKVKFIRLLEKYRELGTLH